ncbi:uncharacterized protein B0I36DRAFT_318274 [Microdochium trichocladiopsis]|uniref:Secreted protein n=1 Tax=Microdochium trichocladiopsis TaxID=1682393 RepID=A0A9P9BTE2_9PEZI|nr:uncharacterized protein B0I36DRAFT_318274 [Microdochium trichocladiopsis]KAH7035402.1 hypothetical protein B0I36DRAFT_318274 [Microdochium trichocladiopsis]
MHCIASPLVTRLSIQITLCLGGGVPAGRAHTGNLEQIAGRQCARYVHASGFACRKRGKGGEAIRDGCHWVFACVQKTRVSPSSARKTKIAVGNRTESSEVELVSVFVTSRMDVVVASGDVAESRKTCSWLET